MSDLHLNEETDTDFHRYKIRNNIWLRILKFYEWNEAILIKVLEVISLKKLEVRRFFFNSLSQVLCTKERNLSH